MYKQQTISPDVTIDDLIIEAHTNRQNEIYPDVQELLHSLPDSLRGICDFVLSGEADTVKVGRALASIIDTVENVREMRH